MEYLTQKEYRELKHKMYHIYNVYDNDGNIWEIYKEHITEYNGRYKRCYGVKFIIKDKLTSYRVSRSSKKNVLNFLNN